MAIRTNTDGLRDIAAHKRLAAAVIIQAMDDARFIHRHGLRRASGAMIRDLDVIQKLVKRRKGSANVYTKARRLVTLGDPVTFLRTSSPWHEALNVEPSSMTDKVIYGDDND
jgi:plastocyanin